MAVGYMLDRRCLPLLLLVCSVVVILYRWLPFDYHSSKGLLASHSSLLSQGTPKLSAPNASAANSEFPRKIWQTAKEDLLSLSADVQSSIQTWIVQNKNYRYEIITAEGGESYVASKYADQVELVRDFLSLRDPLLRADLVRYLVLLADGGTYSDLDTKCLKPVDLWIPPAFKSKTNLVLGIEGDSLGGPLISGFSHPVQFAIWTMTAKPGHFLIELIISRVMTQLRNLAALQNTTISAVKASYMDVMDTTGPGVFAQTVYAGLSQISGSNVTSANLTGMTEPRLFGDVLILPITAFGAGLGHSNAGSIDEPGALVQHMFAGTWKADHPLGIEHAEEAGSAEKNEHRDGTGTKEKLGKRYRLPRRRDTLH